MLTAAPVRVKRKGTAPFSGAAESAILQYMRSASRGTLLLALAVLALASGCGKEKGRAPAPDTSAAGPALGRVIVIGFDGLEPSLVRKWAAQGKLPNFQRVLDAGAFGPLLSVVPPSSAPAWTSAVTGVNPGKHGIYGFLATPIPGLQSEAQQGAAAEPVFATSSNRGFEAVWDVIGRSGRRSTLINIPLTSPADSLNGLMISGFPHASDPGAPSYWPPEAARYLGDYVFDSFGVDVVRGREWEMISEIEANSAKRLTLGFTLFDKADWDLFWLVFTFTDVYQHYLWKFMDRDHPMYDDEGGRLYGDAIEAGYKMADAYLGGFIERMRDSDLLVIMSDHGFGPAYYIINSRNFLLRTLGPVPEVACTDFFSIKFSITTSGPDADEKASSLRNALRSGLAGLKDPDRGTSIVDSVYTKEQLYKGPYLSLAPSVIGVEAGNYLFFTLPRTPDLRIFDTGPAPDKMFSGFHRRRGTLGLYGRYVKPGQAVDARITDIAPIIYAYLGVPAPAEMDGRVPIQAFRDEIATQLSLRRSQDQGYRKPRNLASQDAKAIEKQLRSIGYIQ